jgi:photosystem II stability/assembly factor-like uncharacterized protein
MRTPLALLCAAALCLEARAAHAITLDEIVTRHIAARGGADALKALRSLRLTGKLRAGERSQEIEWAELHRRPGALRRETTRQGLTFVAAWDGREGWSFNPFGGRRESERASADRAKSLAQDADLDGVLVDWRTKGHAVDYLGTEDVGGSPAYKLRVALKDGDTEYVYVDPDAFLVVRTLLINRIRGTEREIETDYGGYEQVGGVWVPFTIDSGKKDAPRDTHVIIERAEANVDADDALFRLPTGSPTRAIVAGADAVRPGSSTVPGTAAAEPVLDPGVLSGLGARNIGSATMSGRIAAIDARADKGMTTIFVGSASGGVWKSIDDGTTFKPVFDAMPVQSIGAVAIDPSNPRNVWVGTGEAWTRNSVSVGDGVYKSTDGGETWTNVGLPESERIARIVVNPRNGDVVYACVAGKLWSDSAERGLYKTVDGGKSWSLVLKGPNLSTGCASVALDPRQPDVVFAGLWDFRRKGWTFRSGGEGPDAESGSGLYRSADGGKTWAAVQGLPPPPWGRVEIAVAPSDPRVVYAFIESKASALYRSADGGATWERRDRSQNMVWRPFYFARLVVDPTNPDRLFKPNLELIVSEDGGRTFSSSGGGSHGDWHDLWIDPTNPKHVIGGDDGGLWLSHDGGTRWWKGNNLPVSQFYHVSVDDQDPYQVYGGLQDNSCWVGDSQYPGGIGNQRWESLIGGDGFVAIVDPSDPDYIYAESQGGEIARTNRKNHTLRRIQPEAGFHEKLRFNWNTPIVASATSKGTIYIGAQFLFRSRDHGDTWERISPDLTSNDPAKQRQEESGGVTVDNSVAEMHTTIYTVSESPLDGRTIWAGTDDGNLQLTRDGGKTWTNVAGNVTGLPPASWVSWVEASRFAAGTAYAAFDRHTFGDMTPWVFRTADFGKTWTRIDKGVRGYAHVIKEDRVKASLLFLGTELGLWISLDGGASWAEFKGGGFPSVAVRDLAIQARDQDLVIATHGRGIWIIDDLTALRGLGGDVLARSAAFLPGRPTQQRMPARGGYPSGDAAYEGRNPLGGAVVSYYQRARPIYGPLKLEVLDADGKLVDTLAPSTRRGLNRTTWTMRLPPPKVPRAAQIANGATDGPRVLPGSYTVRLTRGGETLEQKLQVELDRRAPYKLADRKAQLAAALQAVDLFADMSALVDRIEAARADASAKGEGARAAKLDELRKKIVATKEGGAVTGEERLREHLAQVYARINGWEGRPSKYQTDRVLALRRELAEVRAEVDRVLAPAGGPGAEAH